MLNLFRNKYQKEAEKLHNEVSHLQNIISQLQSEINFYEVMYPELSDITDMGFDYINFLKNKLRDSYDENKHLKRKISRQETTIKTDISLIEELLGGIDLIEEQLKDNRTLSKIKQFKDNYCSCTIVKEYNNNELNKLKAENAKLKMQNKMYEEEIKKVNQKIDSILQNNESHTNDINIKG
jgi:chromosome segregation ATPase